MKKLDCGCDLSRLDQALVGLAVGAAADRALAQGLSVGLVRKTLQTAARPKRPVTKAVEGRNPTRERLAAKKGQKALVLLFS